MAMLLPFDAAAPVPMHSITASFNFDCLQHSVEEHSVKVTVALPFAAAVHDVETLPSPVEPAPSVQAMDNVSRGFSDLHFGRFMLSVGALSAARTLLQQPMTIALTRKQACPLAAGMPTLSIVRQVYRTEGGLRRGLGRGAAALVAGQIATDVITLGVFEYARECLAGGTSDTMATFCGGYAGDAVCQAFRIPFLVIATRQMLDRGAFPQTITSTGAAVMRQGGVRSLYAGLGTTLLVGSQWTGLWWLCYTQLKGTLYARYHQLLGIKESDSPQERLRRTHTAFSGTLLDRRSVAWMLNPNDNGMINSTASIVTSAVTAAVFNPYLVVRTRLQAQSGSTIVGIARQVLRESGVRGFWHGTVLNINACIFDAWLASTTYEWAKLYSEKSSA